MSVTVKAIPPLPPKGRHCLSCRMRQKLKKKKNKKEGTSLSIYFFLSVWVRACVNVGVLLCEGWKKEADPVCRQADRERETERKKRKIVVMTHNQFVTSFWWLCGCIPFHAPTRNSIPKSRSEFSTEKILLFKNTSTKKLAGLKLTQDVHLFCDNNKLCCLFP